ARAVAAPPVVQQVGAPRPTGRLAPVAPATFAVEAAVLATSAAEVALAPLTVEAAAEARASAPPAACSLPRRPQRPGRSATRSPPATWRPPSSATAMGKHPAKRWPTRRPRFRRR